MNFESWQRASLARIEKTLDTYLPTADAYPQRLHQAMRYAALGGGKRIRPLLCYAAGEATGALPEMLDIAAAALEMIHVYSLVHDDLPGMDNDDLRRGKPAVHLQYDEATALLVGDALQTQAFILLTATALEAPLQVALVRELATASGSLGMVGGQAIDLSSVGMALSRAELETMHRMKTGSLLQAAVRMGALCGARGIHANHERLFKALNQYACHIGLAFQIVDDILDATADSAALGKTTGKDAQNDKPTYVSALGLSASRALIKQLHAHAVAAVASLEHAHYLTKLADMIVERAH